MKKNFLFRSAILSATLLCSAVIFSKINANQDAVNTENEEMQQGMTNIEAVYQEIAKAYDKNDIEKYELSFANTITEYMLKCAKNKNNSKDIDMIEQEATKTLENLALTTNEDAAIAATGIMFTIVLSKIMETIESKITTQAEMDNLNPAAEEISKFIERFFLVPMQQIAEKQQLEEQTITA